MHDRPRVGPARGGGDVGDLDTEALFGRYRLQRDRAARNELIERHLWLARAGARRFGDRGEPIDDLEQVALIGLLRAVERFEPDYGAPFASYALATIKGELRRHFRDRTWSVYVPRPAKDLEQRLAPTIESLTHELRRAPRPAEVAEALAVGVDQVLEAMQVRNAYRVANLSQLRVVGVDRDALRDPGDAERTTDRVVLRELMDALPERDRRILELRFDSGLSQAAIAARIGVSQVQVSRLLRRIMAKLRCELEGDTDPGPRAVHA